MLISSVSLWAVANSILRYFPKSQYIHALRLPCPICANRANYPVGYRANPNSDWQEGATRRVHPLFVQGQALLLLPIKAKGYNTRRPLDTTYLPSPPGRTPRGGNPCRGSSLRRIIGAELQSLGKPKILHSEPPRGSSSRQVCRTTQFAILADSAIGSDCTIKYPYCTVLRSLLRSAWVLIPEGPPILTTTPQRVPLPLVVFSFLRHQSLLAPTVHPAKASAAAPALTTGLAFLTSDRTGRQ